MNIFHIFFLVPSSPDLQIEIIANVKLRFKKSSSSLKSRAPPLYIGLFAYVKRSYVKENSKKKKLRRA
jgi:hypothetical protein